MQLQEIPIGTVISFEVYPSAQFGNNFQAVTLKAMFDASLARMLGFDYIAANQQVYATLPAGTPSDPTQYNYFQIQLASGELQVLGIPWIREGTLTIHNGKRLTLIFNDIDETRKARIIAAIRGINENPTSTVFN